jgi:hypothetical protein
MRLPMVVYNGDTPNAELPLRRRRNIPPGE